VKFGSFYLAKSGGISYDSFMKTTTLSPNCVCLFASLLIGCFGLLPTAQAVNPPPDGGYPGGNTAEGQSALQSLTIGTYNTAIGFFSLRALTFAQFNTVSAPAHFFSTMHIRIRPLAPPRFLKTSPVTATRPLERPLF